MARRTAQCHDVRVSTVVDPIASRLDTLAARFLVDQRLPGMAMGVVHGGELAWSCAIGFADQVSGRRVEADTMFRIASITKSFTVTAILQLRDEGRLRLDDPLVAHVPEARAIEDPFGPVEDLTLRRLMAHTSGLQNDLPAADDPWQLALWTGTELLARLDGVRVLAPPETEWRYSNVAYGLLGVVVGRVSGQSYDAYVREHVLDVAGLGSTTFFPDTTQASRSATGHGPHRFDDALSPSTELDSSTCLADGGLWSTVGDLCRWAAVQSRTKDEDRRGDGDRVLDGRSLREMQRSAVLVDADWSLAYGFGWMSRRLGDARWVGHTGSLYGWRAELLFRPEDSLAVVALVNGSARPASLVDDVASLVLQAHRDRPPDLPTGPPRPLPAAHRELLGGYEEDEYGFGVRVEARDGMLVVLEDGSPSAVRLEATDDPLVFTLREGESVGERVVFLRSAVGAIAGVNYVGVPLHRLAYVAR